jgi:hypothetical protein
MGFPCTHAQEVLIATVVKNSNVLPVLSEQENELLTKLMAVSCAHQDTIVQPELQTITSILAHKVLIVSKLLLWELWME